MRIILWNHWWMRRLSITSILNPLADGRLKPTSINKSLLLRLKSMRWMTSFQSWHPRPGTLLSSKHLVTLKKWRANSLFGGSRKFQTLKCIVWLNAMMLNCIGVKMDICLKTNPVKCTACTSRVMGMLLGSHKRKSLRETMLKEG